MEQLMYKVLLRLTTQLLYKNILQMPDVQRKKKTGRKLKNTTIWSSKMTPIILKLSFTVPMEKQKLL